MCSDVLVVFFHKRIQMHNCNKKCVRVPTESAHQCREAAQDSVAHTVSAVALSAQCCPHHAREGELRLARPVLEVTRPKAPQPDFKPNVPDSESPVSASPASIQPVHGLQGE